MAAITTPQTRDDRTAGAAAVAITIAGLASANFVAAGENGGVGPFLVTAAGAAALGVLLFGRIIPRSARADRTAAVLAVLALLTGVVFWTGLPILLGLAAVGAGIRERTALGTGAAIAGGVVAAAALVVCVIG